MKNLRHVLLGILLDQTRRTRKGLSQPFDVRLAQLRHPDLFERYRVPAQCESLRDAGLSGDKPVMVVERSGESLAFLIHQLTYHHLAQGELAGHPYMVSF